MIKELNFGLPRDNSSKLPEQHFHPQSSRSQVQWPNYSVMLLYLLKLSFKYDNDNNIEKVNDNNENGMVMIFNVNNQNRVVVNWVLQNQDQQSY